MTKKDDFITVSELNEKIKTTLTSNFNEPLKIKGEISNIKMSGGNAYLTLKDSQSMINMVSWNHKTHKIDIKNGDDVMVNGKLTCFQKNGSYQITAFKIERIGMGNLYEELEINKKTFEKKGYFSKSKEGKKLPENINRIAILTSLEGAALQDILYVLKSNSFYGEVLIKNCNVQGELCPQSVSNGIEYFDNLHKKKPIDVLIISRGGGSFEDLLGYSHKEIVKAIHNTKIYTISAVGHEVDTMLSDYSADYRAPTPSISGEVISCLQRKRRDNLNSNIEKFKNLRNTLETKLCTYESKISHLKQIVNTIKPENFIDNELNSLNLNSKKLNEKIKNNIKKVNDRIEKLKTKSESYNPLKIFEGGYVAIVDNDDNLISDITTFKKLKTNQQLKIVFADGEISL